jgi:hypothetical protein
MKQKKDETKVGRRDFLRTLGAGAGLAAAVPVATVAEAADGDDAKTKARYRDSEHVKTFYRVNRY